MPSEVLTDGLQFPEGPVWTPDGTVYVTEIEGGCITAMAPDGTKWTFADTGGAPNGAALGPDGYLYVTNNGVQEPGYIQRVDTSGGVEVLYDHCDGQPYRIRSRSRGYGTVATARTSTERSVKGLVTIITGGRTGRPRPKVRRLNPGPCEAAFCRVLPVATATQPTDAAAA